LPNPQKNWLTLNNFIEELLAVFVHVKALLQAIPRLKGIWLNTNLIKK